jgi:hypothetical protein
MGSFEARLHVFIKFMKSFCLNYILYTLQLERLFLQMIKATVT